MNVNALNNAANLQRAATLMQTMEQRGLNAAQADTNGNGQLSKTEIQKYFSQGQASSLALEDLQGANFQSAREAADFLANLLGSPDAMPTGTLRMGANTAEVVDGAITFNGEVIGTIDDEGNIDVTLNGEHITGNVTEIDGMVYEGTLSNGQEVSNAPNGSLRHGEIAYEVEDGVVKFNGETIGTLDDEGNFDVTINGQRATGNIADIDGMIYEGTLGNGQEVSNAPNGTVRHGEITYEVVDGVVKLNGEEIGTLNDDGEFDVTINGQQVTGNIADIDGMIYEGTLGNGQEVNNAPTGVLRHGDIAYEVEDGVVKFNGEEIGTLNDDGEFDVTINGRQVTGNIADVDGMIYEGTLGSSGAEVADIPSGTLRFGEHTAQVRDGVVTLYGAEIGTFNQDGEYNLILNGQRFSGKLEDIEGMTFEPAPQAPDDPELDALLDIIVEE